MQQIQALTEDDFIEVQTFYWDVIDKMQGSEYHPAWEKGVYPSESFLKESLKSRELFAVRKDGKIIAAMVLNQDCNEGYEGISWNIEAASNEVMVIHILCVLPEYQGYGFAKTMVKDAICIAKDEKLKAIRLDVLHGNIPALKLYEKMGFKYCQTVNMFYEDTGWTDFLLYELVL